MQAPYFTKEVPFVYRTCRLKAEETCSRNAGGFLENQSPRSVLLEKSQVLNKSSLAYVVLMATVGVQSS